MKFQIAGTTWPRQEYSLLVTGVARFRILDVLQSDPYVIAQIEPLQRFFAGIDNKNFTNYFFVPELASSLFDNAVKMLCAQAQARALPE